MSSNLFNAVAYTVFPPNGFSHPPIRLEGDFEKT